MASTTGGLPGRAAAAAGDPARAQAPSAFSETWGNWTAHCVTAEAEGEPERRCWMEQRLILRDGESGQSQQLTITLAPAEDGMEATAFPVPFGQLLASGVRLRADDGDGAVLAFQTCYPEGCIARGVLSAERVGSFRAGQALHVETDLAGGGTLSLPGSLDGFTAAHDRLLRGMTAP